MIMIKPKNNLMYKYNMENCDCQICMGNCPHCQNAGCGMCNWCKSNAIPQCGKCLESYTNFLNTVNPQQDSKYKMTFGTVLSIFFITIVIYLIFKKW